MFENNSDLDSDNSDNGMRELREIMNEAKKNKSEKKTKESKPKVVASEEEEDRKLHNFVFGDKDGFIKNLEIQSGSLKRTESDLRKRKAAWNDSDDEDFKIFDVLKQNKRTGPLNHLNEQKSYKDYLTKKFETILPTPKWADLDRELTDDSDEEILQTVGHISKTKKTEYLPATTLQFKQLKDLNRATYCEGSIYDVQFHPRSTAALVSGRNGITSIYSIDGFKNEKLHCVQLKHFPLKCTRIFPNGEKALIGGSKNYYYSYDLIKAEEHRIFLPKTITKLTKFEISKCGKYFAVSGRFGEVHLLDLDTKELIHTFKQEDQCSALKFTNDSNRIITHCRGSTITFLDLRQQRIEYQMIDDGCIRGKTLDISPNGELLATGSNEGVVNIYNYSDMFKSQNFNGFLKPEPRKTVYNLTTSISCTKFNHSSEILAYCSEDAPGAVKLIHCPSDTVFSNFPSQISKLGKVRLMEFSPNSGFLAMGKVGKEVPLYRLKHFSNY